jgi:hypothetical protein
MCGVIALVLAVIAYCHAFLIARHRLGLEVAALRQQLVVLKRKQTRPHLSDLDRAFRVTFVAGVGECPDHRKAGYRRVLAPYCFWSVLVTAVAA